MAIINVSFETEKKEYPPQVVVAQYRCRVLSEDEQTVIASSETMDVVVDMPAEPGVFIVELSRLDADGNPLPGSVVKSAPVTVNQLADVPKTMSILLSLV